MVQITLADFMDFVCKNGPSKLTKVRRLKTRPPYRPNFDYYRPLREGIVRAHRDDASRLELANALNDVLANIEESRVQLELARVAEGYRTWIGRKHLSWFEPPRATWTAFDANIVVNPDLGLVIDGTPHVIKMWFKHEPLEKRVLDVVLRLMEEALDDQAPPGTEFGILDVRRARLFTPTVEVPAAGAQLHSEVAYLSAAWGGL